MSGSSISALRAQRQGYVNQIADTRDEITRCERAYESLSSFKTTVSQSQEDFHSINESKVGVLSQIDSVKENSLVAQQYQAGMQNAIGKIGTGVVGMVYVFLLTSIAVKLQGYTAEISGYEATIASCQREIAELDRQIEAAEQAEAARAATGGGR